MNTLQEEYALIAQFMGYRITTGGMIAKVNAYGDEEVQSPLNKKYKDSWNNLMEVVEAIETFGKLNQEFTYSVVIKRDQCSIKKYKMDDEVVMCVGGPSKISRVYSCVLEFIKLTNKKTGIDL